MGLPVLEIEISSLAEIGVSVDSFFVLVSGDEGTGSLPTAAVGRCYAYELPQMSGVAQRLSSTWHGLMLEASISGLWEEKTTRPVLVAYLPARIVRLFVFTKQRRFLTKIHDRLCKLPGYVESGRDFAETNLLRAIAYWDPPSAMSALWPLDFNGRSPDVPSVVDAGAALGYFSYPESDHQRVSVEAMGRDYIRVPRVGQCAFHLGSQAYRYQNCHYRLLVRGRRRPLDGWWGPDETC